MVYLLICIVNIQYNVKIFLFHIQAVQGFNIGRDTAILTGFLWLVLVPPHKCHNSALKYNHS
jgi:hypothetical protein